MGFREEAVEAIEQVVYMANKHNLHVSLNLHRAPGFCINAGFYEPFNLWKDEEAQQAFYEHWEMWAKRFKSVSRELLSFDLVNEPCFKEDMNDQFSPVTAIPGDIYRKVAIGCLGVIHKQNVDRLVIADGNHGGSLVIPEITDLPIGVVDFASEVLKQSLLNSVKNDCLYLNWSVKYMTYVAFEDLNLLRFLSPRLR